MAYEKEDMEILQERYSDILKIDYIECDIGWFDILDKALSQMLMLCCETGESIKIVQIKEKFGGLRIYYDLDPNADIDEVNEDFRDKIEEIIYNAENESYTTCEVCGEEGKPRKGGWIKTLCNDHNNK